MELFSAGVIAALVTGIFLLVISIKKIKYLVELEILKWSFTVEDAQYTRLSEAFDELQKLLPKENLVGHFVMNMPAHKEFAERGLSEAYEVTGNGANIISIISMVDFDDIDSIDENTASSLQLIHVGRIVKVAEIEELYFALYRDQLGNIVETK